ncbi:MAG: hypothetical protein J6B93_03335 [Clostridia bacterium]|nr:hypothetical protein [Clostridia bacterium]
MTFVAGQDYTIDASAIEDAKTGKTVINVMVYRNALLLNSISIEDDVEGLQVAGSVGVSAGYDGTTAGSGVCFTELKYHTTDNDIAKVAFETNNFADSDFSQYWTTINGNTGKVSVADGEATIVGANNTRANAQFLQKTSLNQEISTLIKNPHIYTPADGETAATKTLKNADAVIWLRASSYTRTVGSTEKVPLGYYVLVDFSDGSSSVQIKVYKLTRLYDSTTACIQTVTLTSEVAGQADKSISFDSWSNTANYCDVKIDASIKETSEGTVIEVKPWKVPSTGSPYNPGTIVCVDNDADLKKTGAAGLSAQSGDITFKSFKVATENEASLGYVTEKTAKSDGTFFGQALAVENGATYQLSVISDTGFANEPLAVAYGSKRLEFTENTEGVIVDSKYKKYTFTFSITDGTTVNTMYDKVSGTQVNLVPVMVGYTMINSAVNNHTYTHFELRKITDGVAGANLIFNGDFKMGLWGWTDGAKDPSVTVGKGSFKAPDSVDVAANYNRLAFHRDENQYNYWSNFVADDFTAGDVNTAEGVDICDLVYLTNMSAYDIYADMNCDGDITVDDETLLRTTVLNAVVDQGN